MRTMSLAAWKKKYLPMRKILHPKSELEAAQLSLRKWKGLDTAITNKIVSSEKFWRWDYITGSTCALCNFHKHESTSGELCDACILFKLGDGCNMVNSSYRNVMRHGDSSIMVRSLEKAILKLQEESK